VLELWANLQAMLQGILQGAGPVGYYYKVLTGRIVKRKFRALLALVFGRFVPGVLVLGVLFLDPCFRAFLDPRSWILKWSAAARPTVACIGHESRVIRPGILKVFRVGGPCG
jgi:hypothetical protein